ncbi:cobalamin-5'-phosphate synthase [Leptolyngbya sp. PCC 7375]|nr:cobalamin-5'-phosphate synthase [Leptolyngbya sp. PCC 7375]
MEQWIKAFARAGQQQWALLNGALLFYTSVPLPRQWPAELGQVARIVPVIGLGLGGLLTVLDAVLSLGMPLLLRSAVLILVGVRLTGGLHLDGAMDTADGLAVQDNQRRLDVMADSHSGAFGVMVAIAILLLKTVALAAITQGRWFALMASAAWGRWGQQWAIATYSYLKPRGKGAFHKQALPSCWYALPWAIGLVLLTGLGVVVGGISWRYGVVAIAAGLSSAGLVAAWLNRRLGGHTGDTYGAVVEWVEVVVLVSLACAN